jgi:large subunit ribosomal protein L13
MKTYSVKASEIKRACHTIDAADKILGKVATEAAQLLMGKHKPMYCRNLDVGDFVVIINADKVRVTGDKAKQKTYYRHSGYPGGFKSITYEELMQTHPTRVIEHAVKGMLPRNRLGNRMIKKLTVYVSQSPQNPPQVEAATTEATTEKS